MHNIYMNNYIGTKVMNNTCKKKTNMGTKDKRFQSTSLFTNTSFAMQAETSVTARVPENYQY